MLLGARALSTFAVQFTDPELSRLASCLPLRCLGAKADSTTECYSRAFEKFYGLPNPCESSLAKGVLESAKRSFSRPVVKKEPVTPDMIFNICQKYASVNASLSDLRTASICVTAHAGFLRYSELAYLRCCDVKFCNNEYVELFIAKSDIHRNGNVVILAKTDHVTCPFTLLNRYVQAAGIDLSSTNLKFFRTLHFVKSKASYTLRSTGISYTRAREVVLDAFSKLGYPTILFGLHSLRSGGATAAANAGVNDRLFKRHGRWRSDKAKGGYVKDITFQTFLATKIKSGIPQR